ncbi:hypothetical protein [Streptomyces mirabilis]
MAVEGTLTEATQRLCISQSA